MDQLARMLENARFYGAKSEPIDEIETLHEADLPGIPGIRLLILRVHHGGKRDLYQVCVDESGKDVFANPAVIARYGNALAAGTPAGFGTLEIIGDQLSATLDIPGRMISGEQSNTSLIFGKKTMLKVFRRLEAGENPDVELLSQISECANIAPVRGWVTEDIDGASHTLAMVQDFVPDAEDGWRFALNFAGVDASFGVEAALLGESTQNVHAALAGAFPTTEVDSAQLAAGLEDNLDELVTRAPVLARVADQVRAVYRTLPHETHSVQRIHGDLHLGQVLRTPERYVLIDFEGEPARPLEQRRRPDSVLRDLAGIIRSFDYAAHFPARSGASGPANPAGWAADATAAFLEGYGVERSPVLDAYVLDKALYEVVYESDNRPDWVDIPLAAIDRLLAAH
ncbi:hypothetical protein [Corynebacterium alimapuense]|uniref:Uncharacterized protein n=1 Tax=Corynebacterium alimapuense TaxID=1576874 RepID=A0A3M8KAN0_9CORY|nr:hypothetical protein [Corynebacterium alimapuense]RNE49604.1 hypothetical protein C5L39_04480 [Corynebacterium alimapuense]